MTNRKSQQQADMMNYILEMLGELAVLASGAANDVRLRRRIEAALDAYAEPEVKRPFAVYTNGARS